MEQAQECSNYRRRLISMALEQREQKQSSYSRFPLDASILFILKVSASISYSPMHVSLSLIRNNSPFLATNIPPHINPSIHLHLLQVQVYQSNPYTPCACSSSLSSFLFSLASPYISTHLSSRPLFFSFSSVFSHSSHLSISTLVSSTMSAIANLHSVRLHQLHVLFYSAIL